ncbi:MAG: YceI family protein [Bdellovibrionota bacterium]
MTQLGKLGPIFFFFMIFTPSAFAQDLKCELRSDSGKVSFIAIGRPSALKIHGKGNGATGNAIIKGLGVSGSFNFDLSTLETGMSLRDRHMKEKYLEIAKFPKAELTIVKMAIPGPLSLPSKFEKIPFEGALKLHGVEVSVQGLASVERAGDYCNGTVTFSTKIPQYGIAPPSFAGIKVADDVDVQVVFQSLLKEAP